MFLHPDQELIIRLSIFISFLLFMLIWELQFPRKQTGSLKWQRRGNNMLLVIVDTLLARLLIPIAAVTMAAVAFERGWGLFNNIDIGYAWSILASFLLLDFIIYWQHRLFHHYRILWRVHSVHHSDTEFDVTTGVRFHPFEIILSLIIKLLSITLLGAPLIAVLIFEVVLSTTSLFNHGNVRIWPGLDKWLRMFIVTPDMHRVHHSPVREETDSNFGFNLPWWDRIFGTYIDQPQAGHEAMTIGLNEFRDKRFVNVIWLLKQPFLCKKDYMGEISEEKNE